MRHALLATLLALPLAAPAQAPLQPHQRELRAIFEEVIGIDTTNESGDCTAAANAMAVHLKAAGFGGDEMQVLIPRGGPKKGNLVARIKGSGSAKPILLLAHLDVVTAKREDWERDPFKLYEIDGTFYGRGASDDKARVAIYTANMARMKREGYKPARDVVMALTCDEETFSTGFNGVEFLLREHRALIDAEIVLNEGGGGSLDREGKPVRHSVQAGEKVTQTFKLEITHPGGHSSVPLRDNPIYHLADAVSKLAKFDFPMRLTETTRAYFKRRGEVEQGRIAEDMRAILKEPPDAEVVARFSASPFLNATIRTTCVTTMLDAGHAANALPQRAQATVNCRILPGESPDEVRKTLEKVIANERIKVTPSHRAVRAVEPPLNPALMKAIEEVTEQMWPGVPVIPTMLVAATDGRFLNNAGIWTYGVTGIFHRPEGSFAHGLNERIPVKSLYEGQEFLDRLVRRLAG